jgi:amino acid transporter
MVEHGSCAYGRTDQCHLCLHLFGCCRTHERRDQGTLDFTTISYTASLLTSIHQDAGRTVPTAMIGSYLLSGVLSVIFLISYLFVIVDIEGAVNHPTGYPFLYVFTQAFSMDAVNVLTSIVICLVFAGTLSYNLSSSRQVWAVSHAHRINQ